MSDQPSSSNSKNMSISTTPNQSGKTKVFILSPDILKKLGITSKIQVSNNNPSTSKNSDQIKKNTIEQEKKVKDDTKNSIKIDDSSVKTKLFSMLTTKLEKINSTSSSVENKIDKQEFHNKISLKETTLSGNDNEQKLNIVTPDKQKQIREKSVSNKKLDQEYKSADKEETNSSSSTKLQSSKRTNIKCFEKPVQSASVIKNTSNKVNNENKKKNSEPPIDTNILKLTTEPKVCQPNICDTEVITINVKNTGENKYKTDNVTSSNITVISEDTKNTPKQFLTKVSKYSQNRKENEMNTTTKSIISEKIETNILNKDLESDKKDICDNPDEEIKLPINNNKTDTDELIILNPETNKDLKIESKLECTEEVNQILKTNSSNSETKITANIDKDNKTINENINEIVKTDPLNMVSHSSITSTITPKGRKRKLLEENFTDDELLSRVRKSGRKRKLSTLHNDFVTELKLHDGSDQKTVNKSQKSLEKITHDINLLKPDSGLKNKLKNEVFDSFKFELSNNIYSDSENSNQNHSYISNSEIETCTFDTESNNNDSSEIMNNSTNSSENASKKPVIILENILLKSSSQNLSVTSTTDLETIIKAHTLNKNKKTIKSSEKIEVNHSNTKKNIKEETFNITENFEVKIPKKKYSGKKTIPENTLHSSETKSVQETSRMISKSNENVSELNKKNITNISENDNLQNVNTSKQTENSKIENIKKSPDTIVLFRKRKSIPGKDKTLNNTPLIKEENSIKNEPETITILNIQNLEENKNDTQNLTPGTEIPLQNQNSDSKNTEVKRKRGRPPKQKIPLLLDDSIQSDSQDISIVSIDGNLDSTPIKRKRGRPRRKLTEDMEELSIGALQITISEESEEEIPKPTSKRGRGRRRKIIDSDEDLEENNAKTLKVKEEIDAKIVTCATCNKSMKSVDWSNHTIQHNFLCWKVGEPKIDLNNRKALEGYLLKAVKMNKRFKQFICPHCEDEKKSVVGFLSHLDICQKSDEEIKAMMEQCTICNRKVMPQSMRTHMKFHEDKEEKIKKLAECIKENSGEIRTKRKAATKAQNLIQEVTNDEDVIDSGMNKRGYKQYKEPGSVFLTYGVIKKFQMQFQNISKKCIFNCGFECEDFGEMKSHLFACPIVNINHYICKYCLHLEEDEKDIISHISNNHVMRITKQVKEKPEELELYEVDDQEFPENIEDFNLSDDELLTKGQKSKMLKSTPEYTRLLHRVKFLAKQKGLFKDRISSYLPAIKWTNEYCKETFSKKLFENIKCYDSNWIPIPKNEEDKYIPRLKKSMSVKVCSIENTIPNLQQTEHEWKEYDLYESSVDDDSTSIFCGGPISALAWVPTPYNSINDQYLAVSIQKDFEKQYKISEAIKDFEIIQFWNFGKLDAKEAVYEKPKLEFSLAHNHGMIWWMEWCPSGIYEQNNPKDVTELRKLGLLALACSDGNIPIYAIGIPNKIDQSKINNIFMAEPVFNLVLHNARENLLGSWFYQSTKISWSKGEGHNIIAGGYSNGTVCLWDLENSSPLLKSQENGTIILKPYHSFLAHNSAVSAIILYPLIDKGKRWLLTGSWDRTFKYWDLTNTSYPTTTFGKRGVIIDGVWISHWLCSFFAFDDVFGLGHTVTTVQNPRDFGYKQCSALASNSVVMCLSASDWANSVAQGTLAGELITTFPRTILMTYDVDKTLKCKRMMFSYNEIIDKTKDISERKDIMRSEKPPEKLVDDDKLLVKYLTKNNEKYIEEPITYKGAQDKYGLIFCDFKLEKFTSIPPESLEAVKKSSSLRESPTELYPFMSLNRVQWNPNRQAFLFVASGYQNGFVRLRCVQFMLSKYAHMYMS